MDLSKTGIFISVARKKHNMTQIELAAKIGVTDKAVSRWETGKGFPDVSLLPSLSMALGVSISEIVMGEKIELEEKRALEIMDQAVKSTLDYSHRQTRSGAQFKRYIVVAGSFILAFIALFAFFFIRDYGGKEFVFDGDSFRLTKVSSRQITLRDTSGEDLVFVRNSRTSWVHQEFTYKGNNVTFGGGHDGIMGPGLTLGYTFSDGTRAAMYSDYTDSQQREIKMLEALREYFDNDVSLKYRYPFYYTLGLIIVIICVPLVLYPIFYTEESFERGWYMRLFVHGGAPTEFALDTRKAVSWIVVGVLVVTFLRVIVL